jgi:membrane protein implicated in regulation of membrane protease activity
MRFEIPQYIEIEDKIFGPLSWRQFLYLFGGIGMAIALFLVNIFLFLIVGLPLAVLAGALAFFPVNNRPFSFFLEAILTYFKSKRLYLWRQNVSEVRRERVARNSSADQLGRAKLEQGNVSSLARRLELKAMQKEK